MAESATSNIVFEILTRMRQTSTPETHALFDRIIDEIRSVRLRGTTLIKAMQQDNAVAGELVEGLMTSNELTDDDARLVERKVIDIEDASLATIKFVIYSLIADHALLESSIKIMGTFWGHTRVRMESARQRICDWLSYYMPFIHSNDTADARKSVIDAKESVAFFLPQLSNPSLRAQMDNILTWDFDVLTVEKLTRNKSLVYCGYIIFQLFDIQHILHIDESIAVNWLTLMESNYHSSCAYHNSTHAADVMQAAAYLCNQDRLLNVLDEVDRTVLLTAAIVHDLDHLGRTNPFLINSQHQLALLYNDLSVMENHHVSHAFQLMSKHPSANIFQNLDRDTFRVIRQQVIDLVLATDMSKHFDHVNRFVEQSPKLATRNSDSSSQLSVSDSYPSESSSMPSAEVRSIIKRMLIKCSDVSNPLRPTEISKVWASRISQEYFEQTDEEKVKGLPIVMPFFDRQTCSIPKAQITFIDLFINNLVDSLNAFCPVPEFTAILKANTDYWREQLDQQQAKAEH